MLREELYESNEQEAPAPLRRRAKPSLTPVHGNLALKPDSKG